MLKRFCIATNENELEINKFFTICTKLAEMALLYSKDLTTAKKVTSSGPRPDARDYYWFRRPMPSHLI